MHQNRSAQDTANHLNLGSSRVRDVLLETVDLYRKSPLFALPDSVRHLAASSCELVIFGTTAYSQIFIRAANARGIRVLAAVDDYRPGLECGGKPIIASRDVAALVRRHPGLVAVSGGRNDRAIRHFERLGDQNGVPVLTFEQAVRLFEMGGQIDYRVADWGPAIAARTDEYLKLEQRAADDYSKETLYSVLMFHLTGSMEWINAVSRPYPTLYFRSGLFSLGTRERFVDCGASIGESTGGVLALSRNQVERVWMIEPDKFNQEKLRTLIADQKPEVRARLSLHDVAVGSAEGRMPFNHVGGHTGSISTDAHSYGDVDEVRIMPIDAIVDAAPTLIKMDIEGAELDALKGATGSIRAGRPTMAISAYHRTTDLIDLPRFVDSLDSGYRIGLRHHTEERYDTCLYFLPE
jgi:FkbM family methyltransferase